MGVAEFEIEIGPVGHGKLILNGEDISRYVSAVQLTAEHGHPTKLVIVSNASGWAKGQGIVEVHVQSELAVEQIRGMSAAEVENEALQRMEWGSATLTEKVLEIILERIGGPGPQRSADGGGASTAG